MYTSGFPSVFVCLFVLWLGSNIFDCFMRKVRLSMSYMAELWVIAVV